MSFHLLLLNQYDLCHRMSIIYSFYCVREVKIDDTQRSNVLFPDRLYSSSAERLSRKYKKRTTAQRRENSAFEVRASYSSEAAAHFVPEISAAKYIQKECEIYTNGSDQKRRPTVSSEVILWSTNKNHKL